MQIAAARTPYHIRQDSLFWRGVFTDWQQFIATRSEILQNSSLIDVKTTVRVDEPLEPQARAKQFISLPDYCRHK